MCIAKNGWDEKHPRHFFVSLLVGMQDGYESHSFDQSFNHETNFAFQDDTVPKMWWHTTGFLTLIGGGWRLASKRPLSTPIPMQVNENSFTNMVSNIAVSTNVVSASVVSANVIWFPKNVSNNAIIQFYLQFMPKTSWTLNSFPPSKVSL